MRTLKKPIIALVVVAVALFVYIQERELDVARTHVAELRPGPVDVGFSQSMLLHHQQAIAMSQIMLDGKPTGLAPLARTIAATQLVEYGEMRGWLRLWGEVEHVSQPDMVWMLLGSKPLAGPLQKYVIDCGNSPTGMLGLATTEDLNALRQAEGLERDKRYVAMMLEHHEGGVPMAQFAASEAHLAVVRTLASRIVLEQSKEIFQMQSLLAALEHKP